MLSTAQQTGEQTFQAEAFLLHIPLAPPYAKRRRSLEDSAKGSARAHAGQEVPDAAFDMRHADGRRQRHVFRWSEEARQYANDCKKHIRSSSQVGELQRQVVAKLAQMSGNPRDACLRFLKRLGIVRKQIHQPWTQREQQRLVDLMNSMPPIEAARILGRTTSSVYSMLHRLGLSSRQMREWFTASLLAHSLHISRQQVQQWIDRGWLKCRAVQTQGIKLQVIDIDDFCSFIEEYGRQVVGRRLSYEGLLFVRNYVCPPKHSDLLEVRGSYKKAAASLIPGVTGADLPGSKDDGEEDDDGELPRQQVC